MKLLHRLVLLSVYLFALSCSKPGNNTPDSSFILRGCIISTPLNSPIADVLIKVSNGQNTIANTKTSDDGTFSVTINKECIDASYFLEIFDSRMEISKNIPITGFGLSEHDFGNIILYDTRNPYDLPTCIIGQYTYVLHPVLRTKLNHSDAIDACEALDDCGISDWFLPNKDELSTLLIKMGIQCSYPSGNYWVTDASTEITFPGYYVILCYYGTLRIEYNKPEKENYVVPISRYLLQ